MNPKLHRHRAKVPVQYNVPSMLRTGVSSLMCKNVKIEEEHYSIIPVSVRLLQVRVPVSHCFPLEQAPEAFKALMSRDAVGKVLLTPQPGAKL